VAGRACATDTPGSLQQKHSKVISDYPQWKQQKNATLVNMPAAPHLLEAFSAARASHITAYLLCCCIASNAMAAHR
jgi:hypothetical protein